MIDLSSICGLEVLFDKNKRKLIFSNEIERGIDEVVSLQSLYPILLNRFLKYPEVVYFHHKNISQRGITRNDKVRYDLILVPGGVLGIECNKTHIFGNDEDTQKLDSVIEVILGEIVVNIQFTPKCDRSSWEYNSLPTRVQELYLVKLKRGNKLGIPNGFTYTFINTTSESAIVSKVTTIDRTEIDYNLVRKEKGLAYYLISKNSKVEVVANPKYRYHSKVKINSFEKFLQTNKEKFGLPDMNQNRLPLFSLFSENLLEPLFV